MALGAACTIDDRTVSDGAAAAPFALPPAGPVGPGAYAGASASSPVGAAGQVGLTPPANASGGTPGAGGGATRADPAAPAAQNPSAPVAEAVPNLFTELLGVPDADVSARLTLAVSRIFGIGTGEAPIPSDGPGYRLYYELPEAPSLGFIWAPDSNDIRSEGLAYAMMIAVQMDLQPQFDRLWAFTQQFAQHPPTSAFTSWRNYVRWQGRVATDVPSWQVSYADDTGPAPDAEVYMAAALYLADRRWSSGAAVNYLEDANVLSSALLENPAAAGRTPAFDAARNMIVYFPEGESATFTNPSYHLPAFYELFAEAGPAAHAARWQAMAETSRQFFIISANAATGLHPDYANFDGSPNAGGSDHDEFRYDAWRVLLNMALDVSWFGPDARLQNQVDKYHAFFVSQLATAPTALPAFFTLDGTSTGGTSPAALTATLAAGALATTSPNRRVFVERLWAAPQPSETFRYYEELVYTLSLLAVGGRFVTDWAQPL